MSTTEGSEAVPPVTETPTPTVADTTPAPAEPTPAPADAAPVATTETPAVAVPAAAPAPAVPAPAVPPPAPQHKVDHTVLDQFNQLKIHEKQDKSEELKRIQAKPSHLSSGISFSDPSLGIMKPIVDALINDKQYNMPSQIQASTLPIILKGHNLIAQAQSGAGKTIAFVIGMLSAVDTNYNVPQAMCIAPAREIAHHIFKELLSVASRLPTVRALEAVPGVLEHIPPGVTCEHHIIVGTAGTIKNWITRKFLPLNYMRVFVLDEADKMVDPKSGAETLLIRKGLPAQTQILLFSATYTEEIVKLAKKLVPKAYLVKPTNKEELVLDVIFQVRMDVRRISGGKLQALKDIYRFLSVQQSIVFVEKKADVDRIAAMMIQSGYEVSTIHGGMQPQERDLVMANFIAGNSKVLIGTNVIARGVDISTVTIVVNYDLPFIFDNGKHLPDPETYLHRIGRCGRFGRRGIAINFLENEQDAAWLEAIEHHYCPGKRLSTEWDPNDMEALSAEIQDLPDNSEDILKTAVSVSNFEGDAR